MADLDALRLGSPPEKSTRTTGTADVLLFMQDTLSRAQGRYRDKELKPVLDVCIGDPEKIVKWPTVAIMPLEGSREMFDCFQAASGVESIVVKLYYERVEKTGGDNATLEIARYLDFLRVVLYENYQLRTVDGTGGSGPHGERVYSAWPGRWSIGSFLEINRGTGEQSRIRGGQLDVEVRIFEDVIAQEPCDCEEG